MPNSAPNYSKREVARAGEVIASGLSWSPETEEVIRRAFLVAHSWRDSHAFPMRSIRHSVIHHMKEAGLDGLTGARLKRMPAIRGKLLRKKWNLAQLQDLGGCRAIMPDIRSVHALHDAIRVGIRHEVRHEDNYIAAPKDDGYRSHHLILKFTAKNSIEEKFEGRRIELQIRTKLQHAWATTVEAVGLFRGESLKNHQGSLDWLRLFALISAEFAEAEASPLPPGALQKHERVAEIRRLEAELDALRLLDQIRIGMHGTDIPLGPAYRPTHFLIRFDHASQRASVEPHNIAKEAAKSYDNAEVLDSRKGANSQTVVLVEVDKIENLKAAYPNYFGDVHEFRRQLEQITRDGAATEYAVAPRQRTKTPPAPYGDLSWLRGSRFGRAPYRGGGRKT
ncbi:RelA/SpoT domain-containing protein [Roseomonas stagni]|uniref:RelA/SpoT domain-containing protein n=1 Tax=Falsiroseomonas algicola TaxID=2716930 RepID=A0A6M1LJQ4_9PROT|nr:RelA/SpoT domain-containing protein [Falsiroseomonas algicola]NGM20407.1 RelA/SpoT domain-containing protein [Falsiroseomonas algicola]